jgi:hypothetical protein
MMGLLLHDPHPLLAIAGGGDLLEASCVKASLNSRRLVT